MLCSLLRSQFNSFSQQTRLDVALWCRIPLKHERWLLCILVRHFPATIELKWTRRDILHSTSDKGRPQWTNRWTNRCCSYKSILRSFYSLFITSLICVSKLIYLHRCWLRQESNQEHIRSSSKCIFYASLVMCCGGLKRLHLPRVTSWPRNGLLYLYDVFIRRLALHKGRDVRDGPVHLYGDHFDRNGHGAPGQNGRVDDLGVLQR